MPLSLASADDAAEAMLSLRRAATAGQSAPDSGNMTRDTAVELPILSVVFSSTPRPHVSPRTAMTRSVTELSIAIRSPKTIPWRLSGTTILNRLSPGLARAGAVEEWLIKTMPLSFE